jgi:phage terminase Nu1 subunit (DNA packaging protein)
MAPIPVTVAELATVFNLTRGRVYQLERAQILPRRQRGKHDLVGATTAYVGYLQARAEGRGVEGQDVHAERSRLVRAQAKKAELEVAALERDLLPFDEVVQAWQQLVAAFRARTLAIPSKLAGRLAMRESPQIQDELTAAVREALTELSHFDLPSDRPGRGEPAGANGKSRGQRRVRGLPTH